MEHLNSNRYQAACRSGYQWSNSGRPCKVLCSRGQLMCEQCKQAEVIPAVAVAPMHQTDWVDVVLASVQYAMIPAGIVVCCLVAWFGGGAQ